MEPTPAPAFRLSHLLRWLLCAWLLIGFGAGARANHFSGASITWRCVGPNTYEFTLDLFLLCNGNVTYPQDVIISNVAGTVVLPTITLPVPTPVEISNICPGQAANSTCLGGSEPGYNHYQFTFTRVLPPMDSWVIFWDVCCRLPTMNLVGAMGMYVEAVMDNLHAPCNDSPQFAEQTLQVACLGQPVTYNPGANDPDGDHLVYSLVNAQMRLADGNVYNVPYQTGYTGASPIPGIILDPGTGEIVFTPTAMGRYVLVVEVAEYNAAGVLIGTVMRDIMFVVQPCTGSMPSAGGVVAVYDASDPSQPGGAITGPTSIQVCAGSPFCVDVVFTDPDPGTVLSLSSQATALLPGATFTITGANPATGTICWTPDPNISPVNVQVVASDGTCPLENTISSSVNITTSTAGPPPDPGTSVTLTACPGDPVINLFNALGGSPDAGGNWTGPSGAPHPSVFTPGTSAFGTYTYSLTNACTGAVVTSTVTVGPGGGASAGSNGTLSICSTAGIEPLFDHLGGVPQAGGTWTGPGGAAHTGLYNPAVHGPGIYTYSITGSGCGSATAQVVVTEVAALNAGGNGVLNVCSGGPVVLLASGLSGTPGGGGAWTGPTGAPHGPDYDPAIDGPGTYTYTIPATGPCAAASATVQVTEQTAPNAGTDGALSICTANPPFALFMALTGPQVGGTWTDPSGNAHSGSFDPAVDVAGIYVYSIPGVAPCATDQAQVTVSLVPAPNAGADGVLALCSTDGPTSLFPVLTGAGAGGTWTNALGFAHSGTFDPASETPGVFTYTIAGVAPCTADQAQVTISVGIAPNAGADGVLALCSTDGPAALFPVLTGAGTGGTWTNAAGAAHSGTFDPATDAAGVYTYTIAGVAPCAADQAQVTVSISVAPNAGADGVLALCSTDGPTALFPVLTGAGTGGTWANAAGAAHSGTFDPATDAAGVYTYTVAGAAPCAADQSQVTVSISVAPNAGADGVLALCSTDGLTALFPVLMGAGAGGMWTNTAGAAHSGTFDPATDAAGVYTYTIAGAAPCAADQAQVTVSISVAPNAGADGVLALCSTDAPAALFPVLTGAGTGGTWANAAGAAHSGTFDPATDAAGVYTYTVAGAAPCAADQSLVTVSLSIAPNAGTDGTLALCNTAPATSLFASLAGAQPGGTWTDPSGNAHSGTFNPATDVAGVYTYTLAAVGSCAGDQSQVTVTLSTAANAGTDGTLALCNTAPATSLFASITGAQTGGTWTDPSGNAHSGTFNPTTDVAGVYTYTLAAVGSCAGDQSQVTVTLSTAANAGTDGTLALCNTASATSLFASLTGAQAGGTWTDPSGNAHSGTFNPATDVAGVYTYTLAAVGSCAGDQSQVNVTLSTAANAGTDGALALCNTAPAASLFASLTGAQTGGTWTDPSGNAHSGTFNPATDVAGVYTYTLAAVGSCAGDQSQVTVTLSTAANAGTDGTLALCNTAPATSLFASLTGAQSGGTWTDPNGNAHSGTFNPATDVAGVYTYTLAAVGSCAGDQSQVTVTLSTAANAGTDGTLALCNTAPATSLFASITGAQAGGTWTDPSGNAHSGTFNPTTDVAGVYIYTLAAVGSCAGDQSQVTVTLSTAANAGTDGTLALCNTAPATSLFASLTGAQSGGTWTDPSGNTHSGTFNPTTDVAGVYIYTLAAVGSCAGDQSQVTVTLSTAANAGTDGTLALCNTASATSLFASLTGAQAGGTWTDPSGNAHSGMFNPATDVAGVYSYTVAGVAPCAADQAQVTVTISIAPDAGQDAVLGFCTGDAPASLFQALGTGANVGGGWTAPGGATHSGLFQPAVDPSGDYTYTVIVPGCAAASAVVQVSVAPGPDAGQGQTISLCSSDPGFSLLGALVGTPDANGTWTGPSGASVGALFDPATSAPGLYTYTVPGLNTCPDATAELTITVSGAANAGSAGYAALCSNADPISLNTMLGGVPDPGGQWVAPGGGLSNGLFDPATDPVGVYTYLVDPVDPCPVASASVVVEVERAPSAGVPSEVSLCSNGPASGMLQWLDGAPDPGGTWMLPNGTPGTGYFDPATSAAGMYVYQVTGTAPCVSAFSTLVVNLAQPVHAGVDNSITVCSNAAPVDLQSLLGAQAGSGGTWSSPTGGPHSGMLQPSVDLAGTYTYTLAAQAPCANDQASVQVTIITVPVVSIESVLDGTCVPVEASFSVAYTGPGTYQWDLGNGVSSTGPAPSTTYGSGGVYAVQLTLDLGGGCSVHATQQVHVIDPPVAIISAAAPVFTAQGMQVLLMDAGIGAEGRHWSVDGEWRTDEASPSFLFPLDRGVGAWVCLVVTAAECADTACQLIDVPEAVLVSVPNAFTPNGDGNNDGFAPVVRGIDPDSYDLLIVDRWGQPVFSSRTPEEPWNGATRNGNDAPMDVYVWKLRARGLVRGEELDRMGHVTLIR